MRTVEEKGPGVDEDDVLAVKYLLNMGIIRHVTTASASAMITPAGQSIVEWACPLLRMLVLRAVCPVILEAPPPVPLKSIGQSRYVGSLASM